MKKVIISITMILLICACSSKEKISEVSCGYNKNVKLKRVDLESFNCISPNYGKDKTSVYYLNIFSAKTKGYGKKIKNADPKTFEIKLFPRDKDSVYYEGNEVKGADISTFEKLNTNYYRDKSHIYYMGNKIKDVDILSFELLIDPERSYTYFRDKKHVFFSGRKLEKSDPLTFQFLNDGYAKDKNYVYYRGNIYLKKHGKRKYKADTKTFKVLEKGYAVDKKNVYYGYYNRRKEIDPKTFVVHKTDKNLNGIYYDSEDKDNYYYNGKKVMVKN
ncbi:DKNYY domain-containing protein [Sebaldella sp. S0638]|uniref:DKNYY domain-containing protein n=1 Tax=Sebaldella sp. S0638 TaxID=2957809 RepID=UPI0020A196D2|nr:DKNYY domain-containing protein [Sebaldella sp. S0638]MCP1226549.1 DKNYY domain-containing protein [Sebaldella sp. S0638]